MKMHLKLVFIFFLAITCFLSCSDDDDVSDVPANLEVQDFIWKGMNLYYLWQDDVVDLADDRFNNQEELNAFLQQYPEPNALFNQIRVAPSIDRFSAIFSDYGVLEGIISGTTKNNGVDFGLLYKPGSTTEVFGWVRYILPNSDASAKDIQRGDLFYAINGTPLTVSNYQSLLANESHTLNLANYNNGAITPNGRSVILNKATYAENPVLITNVINSGSRKIGYLMYNGFYAGYESQLNAAFGILKSENVTDLVLDLRYNSGGSVATATRLASMITGQFPGQIFAKEQWNTKAQTFFEENNPDNLRNNFTTTIGNGEQINSLNLSTVYVLTTVSTASASELVINGLAPYINVVQIGTKTTGKNVGSITLYDSPDYAKEGRSNNHKYAMQPIVLKIVNKNNFGDYLDGLLPNITAVENLDNLGALGDANEPLLNIAINQITGAARIAPKGGKTFKHFKDVKSINSLQDQMYLDEIPQEIRNYLKSVKSHN